MRCESTLLVLALLLGLTGAGCGGEVTRESVPSAAGSEPDSAEAGVSDAADAEPPDSPDADAEPPTWPCFDTTPVTADCAGTDSEWSGSPVEVFAAASVSPAARLTAMGGRAVLVDAGETSLPRWYVAWFHRGVLLVEPVAWPEPSGAFRVLDVWAPFWSPLGGASSVLALGCDDAGCTIFGGTANDSSLLPMPGYELPAGADVRKLAGLPLDLEPSPLCAFGDGLYCHDGQGWVVEIPAGTAGRLRDVAIEEKAGQPTIAVAEDGTVFTKEGSASGWTRSSLSTSETLIDSSTYGGAIAAVGQDGLLAIRRASDPSGSWSSCRQYPALRFFELGSAGGAEPSIAIDASGMAYLEREADRWCRLLVPPSEPILGLSRFTCGVTHNRLVLTEKSLWSLGQPWGCYVVETP